MTALVFGKTGQLAQALARLAPEAQFLGRDQADLTDPAACADLVMHTKARAVIIAAAYTGVDRAEAEPELALRINAEAPGAIARAASKRGLPLVYISTDYVFAGDGQRPYRPGDATGPLSAYGRSKLAGETRVAEAGGPHVILRTSWVFSAHGANFVKTMLRLSQTQAVLRVVADQTGGPTPADDLARAALRVAAALVAGQGASGIYHVSGAPEVSWAGFSREILARSGRTARVEEVLSADSPTPARRPQNSRLECSDIKRVFGIDRPDWRTGLNEVLRELGEL